MGIADSIASLGQSCIRFVQGLGNFAILLAKILVRTRAIWRRPRLIGTQVHFLGNHSLAIILVAGLFVGLVPGPQTTGLQ